jgi:hypothetical protein
VTENFNYGHVEERDGLVALEGFASNLDGWYLLPGSHGRLIYRFPRTPNARMVAAIWVYMAEPAITGELRIKTGASTMTLSSPYYTGQIVEIPTSGGDSVDLEFIATNNTMISRLVVDQVIWGAATGAPLSRPTLLSYFSFGVLSALVSIPLIGRQSRRWLVVAAIGLLMATAVGTRVEALYSSSLSPVPLDPDAVLYRTYAERFRWWPPWESGIFSANFGEREPFFPLVVHAFFGVIGSSDFHLRVVSATLSVAAIPLVLVAARRRLAWPLAFGVAAVIVLNGPFVLESTRGLRTELEMCLVIAWYVLLDRPDAQSRLAESAAAGVIGAALVLTRTFYLPMILVGAAVSYLGRRRPRLAVAPFLVTSAIVLLSVGGHRLAMFERDGDAFYDTDRYARWLANVEKFELGRELPYPELFPSRDDFTTGGPYVGPPLTLGQYLFVLHSPADLLGGTIAGFSDIFANTGGVYVPGVSGVLSPYPQVSEALTKMFGGIDELLKVLAILGLAGLVVSAVRRRRLSDLLIPSTVVSGLAFSAFLYDLHLIERYRNTIQFYPLGLIAAGWTIAELMTAGHRIRSSLQQGVVAVPADLPAEELG